MTEIQWDDSSAAIDSRQGPREIAKTLSFLVDYTGHHFATEQKHMTQQAYPALDEHKRKHEELEDMLADFIHTFLGNWLTEHIRKVDMQFGLFLREKGISIPEEPQ